MSLGVAPSASASTSTEAQLTGLSGLCLVDGSAFLHRLQDPDIPDRHRIHGQRVADRTTRSASLPVFSIPLQGRRDAG